MFSRTVPLERLEKSSDKLMFGRIHVSCLLAEGIAAISLQSDTARVFILGFPRVFRATQTLCSCKAPLSVSEAMTGYTEPTIGSARPKESLSMLGDKSVKSAAPSD